MVKEDHTINALQESKGARKVCVHFIEEYPESVVKILLAQPLNPLVKLEFKTMERERNSK